MSPFKRSAQWNPIWLACLYSSITNICIISAVFLLGVCVHYQYTTQQHYSFSGSFFVVVIVFWNSCCVVFCFYLRSILLDCLAILYQPIAFGLLMKIDFQHGIWNSFVNICHFMDVNFNFDWKMIELNFAIYFQQCRNKNAHEWK